MAQVVVLGAGTPTPTPERFGSSHLLEVGAERLLFDCGPATTHKLVRAGRRPTQVSRLFFTHHHFDHNADYPCFLLCRWDQSVGRESELQVYGPQPTAWVTERLLDEEEGAFKHDWLARVNHPLSQRVHQNRGGQLPRPAPSVGVTEIEAGWQLDGDGWRVTAARAVHVQPWLECLAYRVDSDEGSVVLTGDTEPCPSVVELARGADLMLCMCWDEEERMAGLGEGLGQTGTLGAARMAQEAGVRQLVLIHVGPHLARPDVRERSLAEVSRRFDGRILLAEEGLEVPLR